MPPQRITLRGINNNGARGKDLTPYMRGKIISMADTDTSSAEI